MTKYAKLILDIINTSDDHPTAEQIFIRLKEQCPSVVMATVYNNLNSLTEHGLIRKLSFINSSDRYDNIRPHDHLICRKCGTLKDIHLTDFTDAIQQQIGIPIDSDDLNIYYTCDSCKDESPQT